MSEQHPIHSKGWQDVYPTPRDRSTAPLPRVDVQVLKQILERQANGRATEAVIIDVRRTDCESMIPTAINLPAHTFLLSLPTLLPLLAKVPLVLFYCNQSTGRGPRAAGWYADALQEYSDLDDAQTAAKVGVVEGGIVGWEEAFGAGSLQERGKPAQGWSSRQV
ncbi:hypothetical protein K437DRAFT_272557 [Tilletiaria anomala UBC 951]|uniref:Rhodanese domain-containing protein n=1 Tax=Tilletiaria anomala (strain ATCC 24038 / CBS 436.72 / UBC 951) TaxID=1037660 RepID=A0A066WN12_TILAU|nr:uncharacterized protein K437DRAFT_272557 [Tilletiaria anomala UBC 951]KDN52354.1 hypothetical protein K437DRAFT_272557 [Tilletiaria anomala UBC 951]